MRADQRRVTLTVDGVDYGFWSKKSGGTADSEELKIRRGAMTPETSIGGMATTENLTLSKYVVGQAGWEEIRALRQRRGKGACTVVDQPLDTDGNASGQADVYTGTLKSAAAPDYDASSADAAELTVEISTNEVIG